LKPYNPNLNEVVDLRNKETLKSFSEYTYAVRPFRNSEYWSFGPVTRGGQDRLADKSSGYLNDV